MIATELLLGTEAKGEHLRKRTIFEFVPVLEVPSEEGRVDRMEDGTEREDAPDEELWLDEWRSMDES